MSQAVDQPRIVNGKKVDCNGAPWIEAGIDMDVLPRSTQVNWREQMEKAKEIVEQSKKQAEKGAVETGVEAPENNEKSKTNLKRKNTLVNGEEDEEDTEDEAVNEDDRSNETVDETGELVEALENNKKPETNLKRKNAMLNGSTQKKQKQVTVNALKHVQEMKANVANIDASYVEKTDKLIKEISECNIPGMQSIVKNLSSTWKQVRKKLKK